MSEPMILVISNRNVIPQNIGHEVFGEEHNADGWDQLRIAAAKYVEEKSTGDSGRWELELLPDDQSQTPLPSKQLFDDVLRLVLAGQIPNRFVFFIHGNNQTFLKNLNKARKLAVIHDVNVVAFSWPSRPDLSGKQARYRQAQKNAARTAPALNDALEKLGSYMGTCSQYIEFNLLVHSLGNLLFKSYTEGFAPTAISRLFRRTVLHQGSPPNLGHHTWVNQVDVSHEIYYTINSRDKILGYAEAIDPKTMGRTQKNLVSDEAIYIDFTGGEDVSNKHQLFGIRKGYVKELFEAILTGQVPELDANFYFDIDDNAWRVREAFSLTQQLSEGELPLDDSNPDYDPQFDDEEDQTISGAYSGLRL